MRNASYEEPADLSKTVKHFWALRERKYSKLFLPSEETLFAPFPSGSRLCDLLEFYDMQEYRYWDDGDGVEDESISLHTAVARYHEEAHMTLALTLGL